MTKLLASLILISAACGGSKPAAKADPVAADHPASPGGCPTPTWSCTMGPTMCVEGGDDLKAGMEKECTPAGGGTPGTGCKLPGALGKCTIDQPGKLTPSFAGCGTMAIGADGTNIKTAEDAKAACDKFKGTWSPS